MTQRRIIGRGGGTKKRIGRHAHAGHGDCGFTPCRTTGHRCADGAAVVLVATKADLADGAELEPADVAEQGRAWKVPHAVVSARTGDGIPDLHDKLIEAMRSAGA